MRTNLKTQFLALLIVLSLGGLTGLEPVLHNHDLDLQDVHEDCFSCGWTQISIDHEFSQSINAPKLHGPSNYQTQKSILLTSLPTSFLIRAPPAIS